MTNVTSEISLKELSLISGLPITMIKNELGITQSTISMDDLKQKLQHLVENTLPLNQDS
ncbi:MAG: hypothetical protein QE271_09445 [Bacteriovoracaceae bacterium]|nr:hypothetical protein [Bacteriovoracaceae bacterium]